MRKGIDSVLGTCDETYDSMITGVLFSEILKPNTEERRIRQDSLMNRFRICGLHTSLKVQCPLILAVLLLCSKTASINFK